MFRVARFSQVTCGLLVAWHSCLALSAETKPAKPGDAGGAGRAVEVSQHQIVPLMLLRCTVCHGLRKQEGGVDLRDKASMLKGGKSGPAMVPGKPDDSVMIKRIAAEECPPRRRVVEVSVKPMEPSEVTLLKKWIEAGAPEVPEEQDVAGRGPDPLV